MIRPISFTGKAYFLDSASKALTDEQRQRIETYANKKGKYIDVVVLGAQKEDSYEYGGKKYAKKDISLDDKLWLDELTLLVRQSYALGEKDLKNLNVQLEKLIKKAIEYDVGA